MFFPSILIYLTSLVDGLLIPQCTSNVPVEVALKSYGVIPDLIPPMPKPCVDFVVVTFPISLQVILGNVIPLNQTQEQPTTVEYKANSHRYYTLLMLDPDVPSRTNTSLAEVRHWHVGNIPGNDVSAGEALAVYMGPMPDPDTGLHRYVFNIYEQNRKLNFTEPRLLDTSGNGRLEFSSRAYIKKYGLKLIASNFFHTEFGNSGCQGILPVEPVT